MKIQKKKGNKPWAPKHSHVVTEAKKNITESVLNHCPPAPNNDNWMDSNLIKTFSSIQKFVHSFVQ